MERQLRDGPPSVLEIMGGEEHFQSGDEEY